MHHKRRRPKNRRAGCLSCKPHKANNAKDKIKPSVQRQLEQFDVHGDVRQLA